MKYRSLGRTNIQVSQICLGTMTWGSQNSEAEGHGQMDYAAGEGVNFFDTAEMYPTTPLTAETAGRSEEIVGTWFQTRGKRHDIILATKITGVGNGTVRGGASINPETIREAVEGSLRRLRTDYIDLYQLHWPNRGSYHFRQSWHYDPSKQDSQTARTDIAACLDALDELVKAGKIRHIGLSNETAWGTSQFLQLSQAKGQPRVATVQNEYGLMHRIFDLDMAELSHHEDVGLLAFSPLAAGLLSGKYQHGAVPPGSRRSINPELGGRYTEYALPVVDAYLAVAAKHGLDVCRMGLAFCLSRPFMTAAIIGATGMEQLKTNISAAELTLGEEVLADIHAVYRRYPLPM